ncbi:unnamed protein product [Orchesella dallaii]|uniref:Retrovirus-related Pol polyprotein from type-1 retrotransposable element R2 n=1 Tax=Orchesella dallaii TaxID=48710 RepID=A0ABP1Q0A0_9HEXA
MQPSRDGETLTVTHPPPETFQCTEEGCRNSYKTSNWTASRQSLIRHLEKEHSITITSTKNICIRCNLDMGLRPTLHQCQNAGRENDPPPVTTPTERHRHVCGQCDETFPSRKGLDNHTTKHRRDQIRLATNATPSTVPSTSTERPRSTRARTNQARLVMPTTPAINEPPSARAETSNPVNDDNQTTPWGPLLRTSPSLLSLVNQHGNNTTPQQTTRPVNLAQYVFESEPNSPAVSAAPVVTVESSSSSPETDIEIDIETVENMDGANEHPINQVSPLAPNHINTNDESVIHQYLTRLVSVHTSPCSDENWDEFNTILEEMTASARTELKIQPRSNSTARAPAQIEDCKYMQKLYRRNRRRAIRLITEGETTPCPVSPPAVEEFFRNRRAPKHMDPTFYQIGDNSTPVKVEEFTPTEVAKRLRKFENTAPGDDQLTYGHWRSLDPNCTVLTRICNICLQYKRIPKSWKTSQTILIHKKGDPLNLANWRPISILRTLYKLYSGLLTTRVTDWILKNTILSPAQKGFMPFDGVFEHNFILQKYMKDAKFAGKDIFIAWLDFADAFGSVPHDAPVAALTHYGAGDDICEIVRDMYTDTSTSFSTALGITNPIHIQSGVHQGDPLSGILFNLVINPVIERASCNTNNRHTILAFADDVTPLAEEKEELQERINTICRESARLSINPNISKCVTLHLTGKTPVGTRPTTFEMNGQPLKYLEEGEATKYLGKPTGFMNITPDSTVQGYINFGTKIMQSRLAPWQKLDAMKTFFYSSLVFAMRTGQLQKSDWREVDEALRSQFKQILFLPSNATNDYLYGSTKGGACNIPIAAEDSDIFHVDNAFKLITSLDSLLAEMAYDDLFMTVRNRLKREPTHDEINLYMSGSNEGVFRVGSNAYQNSWTRARAASRRLKVTWELNKNPDSIKIGETKINPANRRIVAQLIRNYFRAQRDTTLQALPNQGKVMECVAEASASHSFLRSGSFVRFADWRFIHRARLNLVPLNGMPWRAPTENKQCRRCGCPNETLPHVVDHCMVHSRGYTKRHDAIVERIKVAAEKEFIKIGENTEVDNSGLRPDLVIRKGRNAFIIDVTIPFDNRLEALTAAAEVKRLKYADLAERLKQQYNYKTATVIPFVVGALGSWYPGNDAFMKKLCAKSYASLMRRLCVTDVIRWTRDIYIEHITGKQQYTD